MPQMSSFVMSATNVSRHHGCAFKNPTPRKVMVHSFIKTDHLSGR